MKPERGWLSLLALLLLFCLTACAKEEDASTAEEKPYYRITFYYEDQPLTWKRLEEGSVIRLVPKKSAGGNEISRWLDAEGNFVEPDGMTVSGDADYYAYIAPPLDTVGHIDYMGTIASVWFRPEVGLRREEAAQILYDCLAWPEEVLEEIAEQEAKREAAPEEELPAAEPVFPLTDYDPVFSDVDPTCPYYTAVRTAASYHLMGGYPDGTFRPDEPITRAEFVSVLMPYGAFAASDGTEFTDVPADYWAADAIATALANGWLTGFENAKFYPEQPITRAEAVLIMNRVLGYVTDERALTATVPADMYVDVPTDHWAYYEILEATYSDEFLSYVRGEAPEEEEGLVYIDGRLYHVNENRTLDYYEAGFHTIDGQLRYCSEAGYEIDQFDAGRLELDGSMYWVKSNGAFIVNGYHGYLYFGEDGRYTSGDEHLDELVEEFLDGILDDDSLSRSEKLYAAYRRVKSTFGYVNRGDAYRAGSTGWTKDCAITMFELKSGHCYYWAAAFTYAARRLGYQAYAVAGYAGSYLDSLASWHAWVMIDWPDGNEYIFDPELEWSYESGFIDGYVQYRNLYKQSIYATNTLYTFADGSHSIKG